MAFKTASDLIAEAKAKIKEVHVAEARELLGAPGVIFLDCREPNEYNLGRIPGSVFIPRGQLETNIEARIDRGQRVVLYCASGNRSAFAAVTMAEMGYGDVCSLAEGFRGWAQQGGPVEG